jgi:apolipoprotein D and lipocalin family protein
MKLKVKIWMQRAALAAIGILMYACNQPKTNMEIKAVEQLDLEKYLGTWYEIARIPIKQEKGLHNVTATYTLKDNGRVSVVNAGYKKNGEMKMAKATAWRPDPGTEGKLKVRFFWPFAADYLVVYLNDDYTHAIVSGKNGEYAWILSKYPKLKKDSLDNLMSVAHVKGLDTARFEMVKQDW